MMTRKLYSKSDDTVHYWTRDELLDRAKRAEAGRDAALERVAELEDATRWRPGSEHPEQDKARCVVEVAPTYQGRENEFLLLTWDAPGDWWMHLGRWQTVIRWMQLPVAPDIV